MGMRRGKRAFPLLLCCVLASLAGCGKKTPPVPPQSVVPTAIRDLRHDLDEKGVTLHWTFPVRTTGGERLERLMAFDLYRAVVPEKEFCAGCPVAWGEPLELPGGDLPVDHARKTGEYTESLLRPGHVYLYKIRARSGTLLASPDSNTIVFTFLSPPEAPAGLTALAGDRTVGLSWSAPARYLDGSPVEGPIVYQVLRSTGTAGDLQPVAEALAEPGFTDLGVKNGSSYAYRVRALRGASGSRVAGVLSGMVHATPRDMTPPLPPRTVHAVPANGAVRIRWEPASGEEVGGYRVYRRRGDQSEPEALVATTAAELSFSDSTVPAGDAAWYYSVAAFDRATPPNEGPRSREVVWAP